jgi:CMP-N-acetylneuraminic acid synthetase
MDALLFMKGHSERIPDKNIKLFCGKPLFFWVINTLLKVKKIDKIYIDTDSKSIKTAINNTFDAENIILLDRPKHLLGNLVTANDLVAGILNRIDGEDFLQTHVTNPLIKAETFTNAICTYYNNKPSFDTLIGVTRHQACFYDFNREPINHEPNQIERTQDLPPIYEDNSNLYIFSREAFGLWGRVGLEPYMYELNKLEAVDIDEEADWVIAEAIKLWEGLK